MPAYAHCEHCSPSCESYDHAAWSEPAHSVPCDYCARDGGPGTALLPTTPTAEETRNV